METRLSYVKDRLAKIKESDPTRVCSYCNGGIDKTKRARSIYCSEICKTIDHKRRSLQVRSVTEEKYSSGVEVTLNDLPWERRVRCGDITPLFGEFCYACGKISPVISKHERKRAYCSNDCFKESTDNGPLKHEVLNGFKTLQKHLFDKPAQDMYKKVIIAQRLLDSKKQCDWCERQVKYKDCGQLPSEHETPQPEQWVGDYSPAYLFCSPNCRTYYYRTFGNRSFPPKPINKVLNIQDEYIRYLIKSALGQDHPLQKHPLNAVTRKEVKFPFIEYRRKETGKGTIIYRARNFVTIPNDAKRNISNSLKGMLKPFVRGVD